MAYDTQQPYVAVYVMFQNEGNDEVALVKRENTVWKNGYYCLPAGKLEKGESCLAAAVREAKEEAGVDIVGADLEPQLVVHRYGSGETSEWIDVFFRVRSWDGELYNAEPDMHSELSWHALDDLPKKLTPPHPQAFAAIARGERFIVLNMDEANNE